MASRPAAVRSLSAATTRGEQPTVFSLKSRRSLSARPPVGGEYGDMASTAGRGLTPPLGSLIPVLPACGPGAFACQPGRLPAAPPPNARALPILRLAPAW